MAINSSELKEMGLSFKTHVFGLSSRTIDPASGVAIARGTTLAHDAKIASAR